MTFLGFVFRSLRFHARSHLGAFLGASVGSAVLIGALTVGDSVRASLKRMALLRLGNVQLAMASGDRFFRSELAAQVGTRLGALAAPVLELNATATTPDASARANHVQLLGVDERFWGLASVGSEQSVLQSNEVALNQRLAEQLKAQVGDMIVVRASKPSQISRDAPVAAQEDATVALRLRVSRIVRAEQFGVFGLEANQIPPFNAFVPLSWLQERLGIPERANLMLVGGAGRPVSLEAVNQALRDSWNLADAQLELREVPDRPQLELKTPRVFLDPPVTKAALATESSSGVLTYLVNKLQVGERSTPYSMVAGVAPPLVPADLADDEIVVNSWLYQDLELRVGDRLQLSYFVVGLGRTLEERTNSFRVRQVVDITGPEGDRTLMPDFPGLANAGSCREWDAGFAIDLTRIREKDEKYWEVYRGTPKAFVSLAAAQRMWSNRFGNLTAVRFSKPPGPAAVASAQATIERELLAKLDPASLGLRIESVRSAALAASEQSQDFGGLFLGFSCFLIVAALLLTGLMFQFGIERRAEEVGTLLALGFTPARIRLLFWTEAGMLAALGGFLGLIGGTLYSRAMLIGLSTIWKSAVGTSDLHFATSFGTLAAGWGSSFLIAVATIWMVLRGQFRQPARELLHGGSGAEAQTQPLKRGRFGLTHWFGYGTGVIAMALLGFALASGSQEPGAFFGAGALLLLSGICFARLLLTSSPAPSAGPLAPPALFQFAFRNCRRRPRRSLTTVGLLASGSFLIIGIAAFRLEEAGQGRSSGTGGFTFVGEAALPIVHDLNGSQGRDFYGLDTNLLAGVAFVPFRVRQGDDASCLNLNRAQTPRLLGVRPELLAERGAFTAAAVHDGMTEGNFWLLLGSRLGNDEVPAIGDAASIQWALGKRVGDTLDYIDEHGRPFKIRLVASVANSILQGNLLISEAAFIEKFPSETGYRTFLVDAPAASSAAAAGALTRGLQDAGFELTSAVARLDAFNAVQNTYLMTFQVLGGLGLLLGTAGLGVVVLRNVLERRGELALLLAVGFRRRELQWLVLSEHGFLLSLGILLGLFAAMLAVTPALLSNRAALPFISMAATLAIVLTSGLAWTWFATKMALRGNLLGGLRNES